MLNLNNVTLISVDTLNPERTIFALNESMKNVKFASTKLITLDTFNPSNFDIDNIDLVYNNSLTTYESVSNFILYEVFEYIDTDYAMFIEWDGYILNHNAWNKRFLDYDYIGAPWKVRRTSKRWEGLSDVIDKNKFVVGNGGFCIKSRRLLKFLGTDSYITGQINDEYLNQDMSICRKNRRYLMDNGFTFAPTGIAHKFSAERVKYKNQFGWHMFSRRMLPRIVLDNKWVKEYYNINPQKY